MKSNYTLKKILPFILIGFCICFFLLFGFRYARGIFFDFYIFYTAGSMFDSGQDVYNHELFRATLHNIAGSINFPDEWIHNAYVYPPQATAFFSLLAHFYIQVAHKIVLYLNTFLLFVYLYILGLILSHYKSLKTIDFCFLAFFLITMFASANIICSQLGILISILLTVSYILGRNNQYFLAAMALSLTSIKPSFLPFFIVYFIIRRQYRTAIYCLIFSGILILLPLVITGTPIISSLTDFFAAMRSWDFPGSPNSPDPLGQFGYHFSMIHLEPLIYRIFNGQTSFSKLFYQLIRTIIVIYCGWLFMRKDKTKKSALLDFSILSAIAMTFVYHRSYDIFLIFPGLLYIYLHIFQCKHARERKIWISLLCLIFLFISTFWVDMIFGRLSFGNFPFLQESYFWKLILPLPWAGVITLVALLWLKTQNRKIGFQKARVFQ